MRDIIKNQEYFQKYIESKENNIRKVINWNQSGKTPKSRVTLMNKSIGGRTLRQIIAKYSSGYSIEEIREDYLNLLRNFKEYWPHEVVMFNPRGKPLKQYLDYDDMLIMLSLGFMLKVLEKDFKILVQLIDRDEVKDLLYEFIIKAKIPKRKEIKEESYEFGWKLYQSIRASTKVNDKVLATSLITKHLTKEWPKEHKDSLQRHKNVHDVYYGYWSIETAAIVCILNLDDSSFRNHQYYPKDLVDYYRASKTPTKNIGESENEGQ